MGSPGAQIGHLTLRSNELSANSKTEVAELFSGHKNVKPPADFETGGGCFIITREFLFKIPFSNPRSQPKGCDRGRENNKEFWGSLFPITIQGGVVSHLYLSSLSDQDHPPRLHKIPCLKPVKVDAAGESFLYSLKSLYSVLLIRRIEGISFHGIANGSHVSRATKRQPSGVCCTPLLGAIPD